MTWFTDADVEVVAAALIANPPATSIYVADWPEDEQVIFRQHFDVERERNVALRDHRAAKQARAVLAALAPRVEQERADALREAADEVYGDDKAHGAYSHPLSVAGWLRNRADNLEREARP